MARAKPTAPQVSLFPFMSILACLVGTIVVMICILSIIQAQHMGGRPKQEIAMAMEFVKAEDQIEAAQEELEKIKEQIKQLQDDKAQQEKYRDELEERMIKLRLRLDATQNGARSTSDCRKNWSWRSCSSPK